LAIGNTPLNNGEEGHRVAGGFSVVLKNLDIEWKNALTKRLELSIKY
jgi:hypothetical protein